MNMQTSKPDPELSKQLGLGPNRRRFWAGGGLVAVVLVLLAGAAGAGWFYLRKEPPTAYVTTAVTTGPLSVTVNATGTLQPQDQVDVGAEISGRVDSVNADFNDRVRKGQILAVINTDQIRAQLAQAQASLNANKATVVSNEATVAETLDRRTRARALFTRGGISAQDVQIAESAYDRAIASVAKAKADVENADAQVAMHRTTLNKAEVRSPIDGVVLERRVSLGQTVAAAFQTPVLFTLASDLSTMQLAVDIDEADIGLVQEGQSATFTVDAYPQRRFKARLISLRNAPKNVNGVVTFQGVLTVDNREKLLRPGLTATAEILTSDVKTALLVPNGAFRFVPPANKAAAPPTTPPTNGEQTGYVWVLEGTKPVTRDIVAGRTDGRQTEIVSGNLRDGELVITDIASRTLLK